MQSLAGPPLAGRLSAVQSGFAVRALPEPRKARTPAQRRPSASAGTAGKAATTTCGQACGRSSHQQAPLVHLVHKGTPSSGVRGRRQGSAADRAEGQTVVLGLSQVRMRVRVYVCVCVQRNVMNPNDNKSSPFCRPWWISQPAWMRNSCTLWHLAYTKDSVV